ncbi:sensor histidine kinase [Cohnella sp. GCM10027633]|uniref:sensor histidine kinase n=1 Tax=unclassified Cohnella TaxID=2636738 RepID=UPI003625EF69
MLLDRLTIFHKVMLFIVFLLIPILVLHAYSNRVSVGVVQNEIENAIESRLAFAQSSLNLQLDHLTKAAMQLGSDPIVKSFETIEGFESYFDIVDTKRKAEERITIQNNLSDWPSRSTIYFPKKQEAIDPAALITYHADQLAGRVANEWVTEKKEGASRPNYQFFYYSIRSSSGYSDPLKADNVVELRFDDDNLIRLLDNYKATGQGDPFMFHAELGIVANPKQNENLTEQVARLLRQRPLERSDSFRAELSGQTYQVNYFRTNLKGWAIVDYVPMQQVLSPIVSSTRLFYASIALQLLLGVFAAFMLYRHVQRPILTLMRSLRKVKNGDFNTRIQAVKNTEFSFVFQRFNDMTEQIQRLVENVYSEQLRSRDAQLKQLQSQINPHFLYNCLYFIVNMARLERLEPIERMAINLGNFFKYTTRLEKPDTTIADELLLIQNYLEIQKLRLNRIDYTIEVPEKLKLFEIPRLLLQPIVENAVIHGIEPKPGGGSILITGGMEQDGVWLEIEDNGVGMSEKRLQEVVQRLKQPVSDKTGYGVWNVNQRLALRFGDQASVQYRPAENAGTIVRLAWTPTDYNGPEGEGTDVPSDDRR